MSKYLISSSIIFALPLVFLLANNNQENSDILKLPPIETFITEPITIKNLDIWIPAAKSGPVINRSCRVKEDCSFSSILPASVEHTKTESCPQELARLLAEYTAFYHEKTLPLTIFNGWQWEYSYSLSQFETVNYNLADHGGSREDCWEAVLIGSIGSAKYKWLRISGNNDTKKRSDEKVQQTTIKVNTYESMRIRDGYPKIRKIQ